MTHGLDTFDLGYMAASRGLSLRDNPYVGPEQREYDEWRAGWMSYNEEEMAWHEEEPDEIPTGDVMA